MTIREYDGSKLDGLIFREILIVPSQPKLSLPRNLDSFPEVKLFFFGQPCHDHKMMGHPAVASTKMFYRNARYIHNWDRDRVSHWLSMVLKLRGLWDLGDHLMLINELCFKYFLHLIAWCTRPLTTGMLAHSVHTNTLNNYFGANTLHSLFGYYLNSWLPASGTPHCLDVIIQGHKSDQ